MSIERWYIRSAIKRDEVGRPKCAYKGHEMIRLFLTVCGIMEDLVSTTEFLLQVSRDNSQLFRRQGASASSEVEEPEVSCDAPISPAPFPDIQLRDASNSETLLVHFMNNYEQNPLILDSSISNLS